jgi:short-subunit dehydrogenase
VLTLEPGATQTEFQEAAGEVHTWIGEPPAQVVDVALDALGQQPSVISGWWNWLRANLASRLATRHMVIYIARDVVREQTPPDLR